MSIYCIDCIVMSILNTYKSTLGSFLSCGTNTKILVTTEQGFELIKNVFSPKNILDCKIAGTCLISDVIPTGDRDIVFFVDATCLSDIVEMLRTYTNKMYIYFYMTINHTIIPHIISCDTNHLIQDIAHCTMDFNPISNWCAVGNLSSVLSVVRSLPATVLSPSDSLRAKMIDVISACGESSILFNTKNDGKLFIAYERSYDQLIPLLFPWKYESMLHFYNVKLDGAGLDDYIYEQIRYKSYAEAILFVKTETEKLKTPNRDNVLEVMEYDRKNKICSRHIKSLAQLEKILIDKNIYVKSDIEQRALIRDIAKDEFTSDKDDLASYIYSSSKHVYKSDLPIYSQFVPTIRYIMESIVNTKKKIWGTQHRSNDLVNNVYIYVTQFITYAEVAEVELFNQSNPTIRFHLISENITDYWNYLPSSNDHIAYSKCDRLKINRPLIKTHTKRFTGHYSHIESNIKQIKEQYVPKQFGEHYLREFSESDEMKKKIIDETTLLITTEYEKLKSFTPSNPIDANDKKIKLIELNELSAQFKTAKTQYHTMHHTMHTSGSRLLEYESHKEDDDDTLTHNLLFKEILPEHESIMREREKQIKQIVDGIRDINQTFVEIQFLVASQGIMIDQIEMNILKTSDFVSHGVMELEKAKENSKTGKKLMTTIASGLGTIAVALGLGFGIKAAL